MGLNRTPGLVKILNISKYIYCLFNNTNVRQQQICIKQDTVCTGV
jgi:hypothetical protein